MRAATIRQLLVVPWRHGEHIDLNGVICEGRLDLSGLNVAGFDFSGARFPDGIDARKARFQGLAWFTGAVFGKDMLFDGACFFNDARLEDTRFEGLAGFAATEFRGIGRFDRARFEADADFANMVSYGNFSLHGAMATGTISFKGAEWLGGLWCQGASLPADANMDNSQVHGRLWLKDAKHGNGPLLARSFGMSFGYDYS